MPAWPKRARCLSLAVSVTCAACSSPPPVVSPDAGTDSGSDAACSAASLGSAFETVETRCDGIDNDCDGVVDARWVKIHDRSSELTWEVPAISTDAGFLVVRFDPHANVHDGGLQLERLNARLEHGANLGALPLPAAPFGSGQVYSVELLQSSAGITAAYVRADTWNSRSLFQVLLAHDGTPIAAPDGEPKQIPQASDGGVARGVRFAASPDGTQLLSAWSAAAGSGDEPTLIQGVVTTEHGAVAAGPAPLMMLQGAGATWLALQEVVVSTDGTFIIAAEEGSPSTSRLRVQKFAWDLQSVGGEREVPLRYASPVSGDALVRMVVGQGSAVLAYRDRAADGGAGIYVVDDIFDGGSSREWIGTGNDVPWFELARTSHGVQVAYKAQHMCPGCPSHGVGTSYEGRVLVAGTAGVARDVTPGAEEIVFPGEARPGTQLVHGQFGGDLVFFVPVENAAGTELQALWYCAP